MRIRSAITTSSIGSRSGEVEVALEIPYEQWKIIWSAPNFHVDNNNYIIASYCILH